MQWLFCCTLRDQSLCAQMLSDLSHYTAIQIISDRTMIQLASDCTVMGIVCDPARAPIVLYCTADSHNIWSCSSEHRSSDSDSAGSYSTSDSCRLHSTPKNRNQIRALIHIWRQIDTYLIRIWCIFDPYLFPPLAPPAQIKYESNAHQMGSKCANETCINSSNTDQFAIKCGINFTSNSDQIPIKCQSNGTCQIPWSGNFHLGKVHTRLRAW